METQTQRTISDGLAFFSTQSDIKEVEIFASQNTILTARINYTSHLLSNGLEEPKSTHMQGIGLRVAFKEGDVLKVGFGQETGSFSVDSLHSAYRKAREGAVHDPDFNGFPTTSAENRTLWNYHDDNLLQLSDETLVRIGWQTIQAALEECTQSPLIQNSGVDELGLILGGDVTVIQEEMAIASTHLPQAQEDTSTIIFSSLTSMIEKFNSKGSGWSVETCLDRFSGEAGKMAVQSALHSREGTQIDGGTYAVVLAPQAVSDLFNNVLIPSLRLDTFYAGNSCFQGKLGKKITSDTLSIYDMGNEKGLAASKGITCEGLPTGKTTLVSQGILSGLLSNDYERRRILKDPRAEEKLGVDPRKWEHSFVPRNGFRFGQGGGRNHAAIPSISSTNLVIEGGDPLPLKDLVKSVSNGIYVGRIWYTYPINGLQAGDFTATIVGDSYLIKDGKLTEPLKPNTVRINDNVHSVFNHVLGVENKRAGIALWAADEVVYAPHIAVSELKMSKISEFAQIL
jgi:predicted Zn-dependent protease